MESLYTKLYMDCSKEEFKAMIDLANNTPDLPRVFDRCEFASDCNNYKHGTCVGCAKWIDNILEPYTSLNV